MRVKLQTSAVAAAARAGVRHITYTSAINPHPSPLPFIREHGATEDAIKASGVLYAFLRNSFYTEVLLRALALRPLPPANCAPPRGWRRWLCRTRGVCAHRGGSVGDARP
jgi:uncharacterized protein YbjT (DUF2867 family)